MNFARTGDPSADGYTWVPYDSGSGNTMVLGSDIHMESDIKGDQRKEIEPLLHHYFNGCYAQLDYNVPHVYRAVGLAAAVIAGIVIIIILIRYHILRVVLGGNYA